MSPLIGKTVEHTWQADYGFENKKDKLKRGEVMAVGLSDREGDGWWLLVLRPDGSLVEWSPGEVKVVTDVL